MQSWLYVWCMALLDALLRQAKGSRDFAIGQLLTAAHEIIITVTRFEYMFVNTLAPNLDHAFNATAMILMMTRLKKSQANSQPLSMLQKLRYVHNTSVSS